MRGGRTLRENVEHIFRIFFSAAGREPVAEDDFVAGVMDLGTEDESAALCGRFNRPPGERARDVNDVLLRVSTIDAERVELEQLASVILVQPWTLSRYMRLSLLRAARRRSHDDAHSRSAERTNARELV